MAKSSSCYYRQLGERDACKTGAQLCKKFNYTYSAFLFYFYFIRKFGRHNSSYDRRRLIVASVKIAVDWRSLLRIGLLVAIKLYCDCLKLSSNRKLPLAWRPEPGGCFGCHVGLPQLKNDFTAQLFCSGWPSMRRRSRRCDPHTSRSAGEMTNGESFFHSLNLISNEV